MAAVGTTTEVLAKQFVLDTPMSQSFRFIFVMATPGAAINSRAFLAFLEKGFGDAGTWFEVNLWP